MNKDVINISSEDDIADIISKLKSSSQKIVALVPPSSPAVLRSAVNIKLIQKTANSKDKIVVLITKDPTLLKLAQKFSFHVSDSLQSKPYIPTLDDAKIVSEHDSDKIAEDFISPADRIPTYGSEDPVDDIPESELDNASKEVEDSKQSVSSAKENSETDKKSESSKKSKNSDSWFSNHKKLILIGSGVLVLLAAFIVWAVVFAPSASISVKVHTTSSNFSENVTFTKDQKKEDSKAGIFYLTEEKYTDKQEVEFKATGEENAGKKSSGELTASVFFNTKGDTASVTIPANTVFSRDGLKYYSTDTAVIAWDGSFSKCENLDKDNVDSIQYNCQISSQIPISAAEPGEKYNVSEASIHWQVESDGVTLYDIANTTAISGGTTEMVTVVTQSDIDTAISKLKDTISDVEAKKKLTNGLSKTTFVIESSFSRSNADIKPSVNAGDKAKDGKITSTVEFKIYTIDTVRLEEFISERATLASDQKIYAIENPFVERFTESDDTYVAKLKTSYKIGPKVTEEDIMNKSLGRKIGELQSILKSINGVSSVDIKTSYFWVNRIPNDTNKLSISLEVE